MERKIVRTMNVEKHYQIVNMRPKTLGANKARLFKSCNISEEDKEAANQIFMIMWQVAANKGFHHVSLCFRHYAERHSFKDIKGKI